MSKAEFTGDIHATEFNMRAVTFEPPTPVFGADGDEIPLRVTRSRNSNGHANITLHFGARAHAQTIELNTDLTPNYEQVALMIAELLKRAVEHGCTLPKVEK